MHVVQARNVNDALWKILALLGQYGTRGTSRVGDVVVCPTPVTTIYSRPQERVLFSPIRDANPFFHLMESLWMLRGRDDVATVAFYNRRMMEFSDDGKTLHGAYGRRWRRWFGRDQLEDVVQLLRNHPRSRRAVVQMWDSWTDLCTHEAIKDIPCNIVAHVQLREGEHLNMTVFCRSNDAIWGTVGANAVHFAVLQEYLAARLGASVGMLYQISNNLHAYCDIIDKLVENGYMESDPYNSPYDTVTGMSSDRIVEDGEIFDHELEQFFDEIEMSFPMERGVLHDEQYVVEQLGFLTENRMWSNSFFPNVAIPMVAAYYIFRRGADADRYPEMLRLLADPEQVDDHPQVSDWLYASREWTKRRQQIFERARDDGVNHC